MLGKADDDPEGRLKIVDVNVKRCIGIFAENELIFGKSGLELGAILVHDYKGRSTLVPIVPEITARWRQMEFCIFCAKSRQNERSSVVCSLNVNKLSRKFFHDFFL